MPLTRFCCRHMQAPDPVKLKGKERQEALKVAEAAAERELAVLISDNSMTWDL
jgi:hypothetical protein